MRGCAARRMAGAAGRLSRVLRFALVASLLVAGGCGEPPGDALVTDQAVTAGQASGDVVSDELIVSISPGAARETLDRLYAEHGATLRDKLADLAVELIGVDPARRDAVRAALEGSPAVEGVADNRIVRAGAPTDAEGAPTPWHIDAIAAPAAWELGADGAGVTVAVLDTGVDASHPLLIGSVTLAADATGGGTASDVHGHGTAVAGVVVADGGASVVAVAPAARVLSVRVADEQGAATSWNIAAGIALAAREGARVINVSLSPMQRDTIVLRQAELTRLADALVVFAAGNTGVRENGASSDKALFVAAVDRDLGLAEISSYGPFVDIAAPGVEIRTTLLGDKTGAASGTSFAAPIVSGVAALVWSANPGLRAATVEGVLTATATDVGPSGLDDQTGAGAVNARAAVELALALQDPADTSAPSVEILAPADGARIADAAIVRVEARDDVDVAEVTLLVDGAALASDLVAPYAFVIESQRFAAGAHTLTAVVADVSGNTAEAVVEVTFADASDQQGPSVEIVSPAPDAVLRGTVTVRVDVRDDRLVASVELLVDGVVAQTARVNDVESRVAINWTTTSVPSGAHTLTLRALDASGHATESSVTVRVER